MPQLGQAMVTGVVVAWHVEDGTEVKAGDPLLTIESDKSAFDIEASATGVVHQHVQAGAEADVGSVLGMIGASGQKPAPPETNRPDVKAVRPSPLPKSAPDQPRASPRARAAAAGKIAIEDVVPSGADGIITVADVERAIAAQPAAQNRRPVGAGQKSAIRRLQTSWNQAPHIVQMIEVDATALVAARSAIREGKLAATLNDIIIKAAADTMAEFPDLNVHIDGDSIVQSDRVDVSIAVATDRGLRTPVLREVDGKTLDEVAALTSEAIEAARQGRSVAGRASLTISNLGNYGVRAGTPVLNLDETVLVFVGSIDMRAVVVDGAVVARPQLTVSIAFDHRAVDGLRAAEFSSALRGRLETYAFEAGPAPPVAHHGRAATLSSGTGLRCNLSNGQHRWVIDEPASIGGSDAGPDPVTAVLAGLLSCMVISFRIVAERRKVAIGRIEAHIATPSEGKVEAVTATLEVWSSAPSDKVEAMLKPAKAGCYVHQMLRHDLDVQVDLVVHATDA
jgi:pyruvate/2-oxoglutarate dehydrogenase complex dihydrolipoamide acyltransferase (E2) component/uncharacterized OsmC-like protein